MGIRYFFLCEFLHQCYPTITWPVTADIFPVVVSLPLREGKKQPLEIHLWLQVNDHQVCL